MKTLIRLIEENLQECQQETNIENKKMCASNARGMVMYYVETHPTKAQKVINLWNEKYHTQFQENIENSIQIGFRG